MGEGREELEGFRERTGFVPREKLSDSGKVVRGSQLARVPTIPHEKRRRSLGVRLDDLGRQTSSRIPSISNLLKPDSPSLALASPFLLLVRIGVGTSLELGEDDVGQCLTLWTGRRVGHEGR